MLKGFQIKGPLNPLQNFCSSLSVLSKTLKKLSLKEVSIYSQYETLTKCVATEGFIPHDAESHLKGPSIEGPLNSTKFLRVTKCSKSKTLSLKKELVYL